MCACISLKRFNDFVASAYSPLDGFVSAVKHTLQHDSIKRGKRLLLVAISLWKIWERCRGRRAAAASKAAAAHISTLSYSLKTFRVNTRSAYGIAVRCHAPSLRNVHPNACSAALNQRCGGRRQWSNTRPSVYRVGVTGGAPVDIRVGCGFVCG